MQSFELDLGGERKDGGLAFDQGRLSPRALRVMAAANRKACALAQEEVGSQHLLAALAEANDGFATELLRASGYTPKIIDDRLNRGPAGLASSLDGILNPSIEFRDALEQAQEEADRLGNGRIDSGHLFLGILVDQESIAAAIVNEGPSDTNALLITMREMLRGGRADDGSRPSGSIGTVRISYGRRALPLNEALGQVLGKIRVWMIFGWLLTSVIAINLLSNIDVITIRSGLFDWINAYGRFIERASDALFGWLDLWRLHISNVEDHALASV